MTRKETHKKVEEWISEDENESGETGLWHYGKIQLHRDIDKIYDDFDGRICENCRFDCGSYSCFKGIQRPLLSIINGFTKEPSFGCTKWESK